MAFTVRPCRPMTLPTSPSATRTSITVVERSRSTSRTSTAAGSRTSFFRINSTASFINLESGVWSLGVKKQATNSALTPRLQTPDSRLSLSLRLRRGLGLRLPADQLPDGVGRLRAAPDPVVDAIHFEPNLDRLTRRVVEPHVLDVSAVALRPLLLHHHPVRRTLLRAHAHQSDC